MNFAKKLKRQGNLFIVFTALFFCNFTSMANNYSIYLVRHAEKMPNVKNPTLTTCGQLRAKQLAYLLSKANISQVYSTHYQRTMQTARPMAKQQKVAIKNYNPKYLEQLSLKLQQQKANTLVVGHSNTTSKLVELLTNNTIAPLTEQDYQYLYQVQYIDQHMVLTTFQQPLSCKKS